MTFAISVTGPLTGDRPGQQLSPCTCAEVVRWSLGGISGSENYMAENMVVPVTGGCPKCGEPNIPVPVDYNDDTIITCPKCGYGAPWAKFFSLTSTD